MEIPRYMMYLAMHIPDGFLLPSVSLVGWLLALLIFGVALKVTGQQLGERQIPVMGVLAAFIFAAQAINFPVAGGTSGHLLGGALAAIVMGPWASTLIMGSVIATQGLLFQDGGLLVMGWNILNMGVFTAFSGYAVYRVTRRLLGEAPWTQVAAAFTAAWVSVEVGAIATSFELAASGTSPLSLALPAMTAVHALIGLGEALITSGAVVFLQASRPQVLRQADQSPGRLGAAFVTAGFGLAVLIACCSPLACTQPDGLDFVARQQGFAYRAAAPLLYIFPDYKLPFIHNAVLTSMLGVVLGTAVVFVLGLLVGRKAARPRSG